jgi:PAS domain S-box-containing protein
MDVKRQGESPVRRALRRQVPTITVVYALIAGLWIALSDRTLDALVRDRDVLVRMSVFKGFAFVAATTLLLYLLLTRMVRAVERTLEALEGKEQERSFEAKERLRAQEFADGLLEALPGIFYFYDEHGRFLRWNDDFLAVSGYSADEVARMHPLEFFEGADRELVQARIGDVFEKGEASVEASFRAKDGRLIPYFFTGKRVSIDGNPCLVGVGLDITQRKQAEDALRELNEDLERIVAQRTADLVQARQRAEAADHMKSAFLATMSHELRTPLNSILGFTGILLQDLAGPLNPEQKKQLGMVRGSARHLLDLITDVLDISKIEAGEMEMRIAPFDPRSSVERVAASVTPLAEKKGLRLTVNLPRTLDHFESDRRRFEQIVLNLVNNALKFTEQGEVTVTLETTEAPGPPGAQPLAPALRVRVTDTGIGIREEDLRHLFQPFRQVDSGLQRQHEGTGLGLAISRRLAELLGGTIEAESVWGQGSTFTLSLPWRRSER